MRFIKTHTKLIPQDLPPSKQHKATISSCNMICNGIRIVCLVPTLKDFLPYLFDPEAIELKISNDMGYFMLGFSTCILLGSYLVDLCTNPKLNVSILIHHCTALIAWMVTFEGSLPKEFGIVLLLAVCVNQHVQYSIYCYSISPTSYHTSLVLRIASYGYVVVEMIAHCTNVVLYFKLSPVMGTVAQTLLPFISVIILMIQIQEVCIMHILSKKIHQIVASDQQASPFQKKSSVG
jgi:hypothetical protein